MARSSPRIGMAFPNAPKSRVRRKPRVRSEWMTFRAATIEECAVTTLDRRGSNWLTPLSLRDFPLRYPGDVHAAGRGIHRGVPTLVGDRGSETAPPSGSARRQLRRLFAACTPRASNPRLRRGPRAPLGRHGLPSCEARTRRIPEHRGCRVAAEAERPCPHHLVVGADRRSLRLRGGTNITSCKEVPQGR